MLKMRLGAVPLTEVNMPQPPVGHVPPTPSVLRSSQYGKMVYVMPVAGRQVLMYSEAPVGKCALPLESRPTPVKVWSYSWKGKGSTTSVTQSSHALPMLTVPATMVAVPVAIV